MAVTAAVHGQGVVPAQAPASAPAVAATAEARALSLEPLAVIPTPQQLSLLMEASRARYRTIDLEYALRVTDMDANSTETSDHIWRWTREREYHHADYVTHEDGQTRTGSDTVVAAPTWSKKYDVSSENSPNGIVMRGNQLMQATESNPFKLMEWRFGLGDAPVKWNEKTGFLEFESRLVYGTKTSGTSFWASKDDVVDKVVIDPSRGFVPVRHERNKADGSSLETNIFEDYREVEKGLWIPWKVTTTWEKSDRHEYTIKRVTVNGEIPAEKLDFEFPPEVQIQDQIINKIYTPAMVGVPEVAQMLATTQPGGRINLGAGGIRPEATIGVEKISGHCRQGHRHARSDDAGPCVSGRAHRAEPDHYPARAERSQGIEVGALGRLDQGDT